jgi:hypothetical protein
VKYELVDVNGSHDAAWLAAYCVAQQQQLREHFAACFDGDGDSDEVSLPRANYTADQIIRIEHAPPNEEDALGFHELGLIHVFDDLATATGTSLSSILSHEVLEARADPRLHACVELDDGTIWDREICDRVEADSYFMLVGDAKIELSNFNTPACFEPPPNLEDVAFDWLRLSTRPNEVRPGGYAQRFDLAHGWIQVGEMRAYRAKLAALGLGRGSKRRRRAEW